MLTCKRVLQCESTCVAGEARTRAACVTSVRYTRVVVYRAQRGERGIGGGEDEAVAKPGAHIRNREIGKSTTTTTGKSGNREGIAMRIILHGSELPFSRMVGRIVLHGSEVRGVHEKVHTGPTDEGT